MMWKLWKRLKECFDVVPNERVEEQLHAGLVATYWRVTLCLSGDRAFTVALPCRRMVDEKAEKKGTWVPLEKAAAWRQKKSYNPICSIRTRKGSKIVKRGETLCEKWKCESYIFIRPRVDIQFG